MSKELPKGHGVEAHEDIVGQVMHRWKHHDPKPLHSGRGKGGKEGKVVKDPKQAIAIAISIAEKAKESEAGKGRKKKEKTSNHSELLQHLGFSEGVAEAVARLIEDKYDFTRCVRPDGSSYGTSGQCRKGTERQKEYPFAAAVTQGRFNIPHSGHAKLIKHLLEKAPTAYVILGTGKENVNRDFRAQMLRAVLRKEGVDPNRVQIIRGSHAASTLKKLAEERGEENVLFMLGADQQKFLDSMGKSLGVKTDVVPRDEQGASSSAIRKMIDSGDTAKLGKEFGNDPYLVRLAQVARKIEKEEFAEFLSAIYD